MRMHTEKIYLAARSLLLCAQKIARFFRLFLVCGLPLWCCCLLFYFPAKKKIMYTQRARTQIKRPLLVSHFNILLVCLGCINVLQNCSKSLCIAICVDGKIQRLQRERYSKQRNANRLKFVRRVSFPNFKWIWMSSSDDQRHLLHSGCSFVGFNGCAGSIAYEKAPNTCDEAQLVDRTTLHTIPSRLPSGFVRTLHC